MISNIWIINKKNSLCVLQRSYGKVNKIDKDLFSGFLTALFNFSKEISGEVIRSVTMGSLKFFYQTTESMIVAISTDDKLDEIDIAPVMETVISDFIKQGYGEKLILNIQNNDFFKPFEKDLDVIISDFEEIFPIVSKGRPKKKSKLKISEKLTDKIETPLLKTMKFERSREITFQDEDVIKDRIIEALENAEYAINNSEFQEATIYYGVAAGLFKELGDFEEEKVCKKFANKSKEMVKYKNLLKLHEFKEKPVISFIQNEIKEEIKDILIIPENLIPNEDIRSLLKHAALAENIELYDKAIKFYSEAAEKFAALEDTKNIEKCITKIDELNKIIQIKKIKMNELREKEEGLIIPTNLIPDEDIKSLLKNAALSEKIELYDKAIKFYSEAAEKFAFYQDVNNFEICKTKIEELNKIRQIEERIKNFSPIILLENIDDKKIKNNLQKAYDAELQKKFKQASLYYNIASGLFLDKNDKKNSKICSKNAKELANLDKYLKIK